MTAKKQLIQVKGLPGSEKVHYRMGSINFAYISSPATGRTQLTSTMTCRENALKKVWHAANDYDQNDSLPPFDFSKLRLLIIHDPADFADFRRKLFSGKAALNILEKINNWEPSSITTVKHPCYDNAWLLTGPAEWLSQPQLLSLATWILRLAAISGPLNTDSYDALEASLYNIKEKVRRSNDGVTTDNLSYLQSFWDKMYIILKYYQEIFKNVDIKTAWPEPGKHEYVHINGGMLSFVDETVDYTNYVASAQKRFRELCGKYLPRKNELIKGGK